MVEDSGDFGEHSSDPFRPLGDLNVQQLLNSQRKTLLVGHHGDVIKSIEVWQSLQICLVLN
jgi:hypothetical protein